MIVARTFIRRFWVGVMLIPSFMKLAVARIVPAPATPDPSSTERPKIKTSRVLRFAMPAGGSNLSGVHYGLEATGVFPYVRVIALQQHSAPVPVEVAPVPQAPKRQNVRSEGTPAAAAREGRPAAKARSRSLTRRLHSNQEKPFCYPANSQSCLNCPECCIVCGSCTSCTSSAGCSSCSDCACCSA
jgi:hypothetical protein